LRKKKPIFLPQSGIPLMERLMDLPIYQKDPITKSYNPRMITKLIRSFRSHPKIIEFPNQAFYDGDLQASGLSGK
jgi:helicase MOV-10